MSGRIPTGHGICAIMEHQGKMHIFTSPINQPVKWQLIENTGVSFRKNVMCGCDTEANQLRLDIKFLKTRIDLHNESYRNLSIRFRKYKQKLANNTAKLKRAKAKLQKLKK